MQNSKDIVRAFYEECLTVGGTNNLTERLQQLLADGFESRNAAETKGKQTMIAQINGFWNLMPDMKWEIQDMVQEGDRVVVRSLFSASPRGNFMGMELDGSKSFKTMAMDMHTVENGQIRTVYHVEEWSTAIAQLKK
ncbi:MAG TPA: ester cyclase [Saprospiraceae bacterium]|nr:ester cyclase [Saprospiraceae bacterium]HNM23788.1 ester cyclase [Saprospiraceae bacterium]